MQTRTESEATGQPRTRWISVAVLFLCGVAASLQFAKVPPALSTLTTALGLGPVEAGFAVSVVGLVGLVLGVAAGSLVAALGSRRALIGALVLGAVCAAAGAAAPTALIFMAGRTLEGISHLVIVVAAPALMIATTRPRDRPIALALWSCFFSVGYAIASASAPFLLGAIGWRGAYVLHAIVLALLAAAAAGAVPKDRGTMRVPSLGAIIDTHRAVYSSGAPLLLAAVFAAYTIIFLAFLTYLNQHLIEIDGFTEVESGALLSVLALLNPVISLATGPLVRAGLDPIRGFVGGFLLIALSASPIFLGLSTPMMTVVLAGVAMAALGALPGLAFTTLPVVAPDPGRAAQTTGAIAQFGNVGTFSGPPLFALLLSLLGWPGGAVFVIGGCLCGTGLAIALRRSMLNRM
ncbi:MAG: CynX/NimT family MFS transporter [Labrys sp. (in: a-proteobacteria)]